MKDDLRPKILEIFEQGVEIDIELINQIHNGNIELVKDGVYPLFTFTDYIKVSSDGDWISGESADSIESAMLNGIKRAEKYLRTGIL